MPSLSFGHQLLAQVSTITTKTESWNQSKVNHRTEPPNISCTKTTRLKGGCRPVVGGCSSNTLGLSSTLFEVVEDICMGIDQPYEIISSQDFLYKHTC